MKTINWKSKKKIRKNTHSSGPSHKKYCVSCIPFYSISYIHAWITIGNIATGVRILLLQLRSLLVFWICVFVSASVDEGLSATMCGLTVYQLQCCSSDSLFMFVICVLVSASVEWMNGVLGHDSALKGYTGPGTTASVDEGLSMTMIGFNVYQSYNVGAKILCLCLWFLWVSVSMTMFGFDVDPDLYSIRI